MYSKKRRQCNRRADFIVFFEKIGGTTMPEVSVIMAVYNIAEGNILNEAIDSILNQTYRDFEFIICDDASTDCTWKILQEIAKRDSRIITIQNNKNRKAGYTRNACIKRAKGRYIMIMDDDDIAAPERIERLHNFLTSNKDYAFVGSKGEFFIQKIGDDKENYWYCETPEPEDFLFSLPFVHASIMFRKEVLEKVNGYDCAKQVIRVEDYDMLLRIYGEDMRGYNLDEVLYYIRRDENQYKRRKYRYRFHEAYVKFRGYKKLGLMPKGMVYVIKPLIVGLIPIHLMKVIQKKYYKNKQGV